MGSRAFGLDLGIAPGISIKNAMLYAAFSVIAIESAITRSRNVELLPVILPFALLILYAILTWLFTVLFLDNPYYLPRMTLIRLKVKLVDQFIMFLVFFYGVVNWKETLWLLKAVIWVIIAGCLITVVDTFNIPDLGIITARDDDGRIEGIIGSSAESSSLWAFYFPAIVALWLTETGLKKALAFSGIGLALVSIMLSGTRGPMLGVVAGGLMSAIYLRQYISAQIILRATMGILVFAAIALLVVLSSDFRYVLEARLSTGLDTGNLEQISSGRTRFWLEALRRMAEHPVTYFIGYGWEAYYQTMGYRVATHNVYLDRFYNLGAIGLTMFLLIYVNAVGIVRRALKSAPEPTKPFLMALVFGMASFLIAITFADLEEAATYIWAYAGLALRLAVASRVPQRDNDRPWSRDQTKLTTRPMSATPKR
jgi:O-antigen ligase